MKWTKETPNLPGWYWVRIDGFEDGIVLLRLTSCVMFWDEGGESTPMPDVLKFWQWREKAIYWAGPVPRPEEGEP